MPARASKHTYNFSRVTHRGLDFETGGPGRVTRTNSGHHQSGRDTVQFTDTADPRALRAALSKRDLPEELAGVEFLALRHDASHPHTIRQNVHQVSAQRSEKRSGIDYDPPSAAAPNS